MNKTIIFLVAVLVNSIFIGCSSDDEGSDGRTKLQFVKFKETFLTLDSYSLSLEAHPTGVRLILAGISKEHVY